MSNKRSLYFWLSIAIVFGLTACGADGDPLDRSSEELALSNDDGQVEICHRPPGNPDNGHDIVVGAPAVDAHRRHGDDMVTCEEADANWDRYRGTWFCDLRGVTNMVLAYWMDGRDAAIYPSFDGGESWCSRALIQQILEIRSETEFTIGWIVGETDCVIGPQPGEVWAFDVWDEDLSVCGLLPNPESIDMCFTYFDAGFEVRPPLPCARYSNEAPHLESLPCYPGSGAACPPYPSEGE